MTFEDWKKGRLFWTEADYLANPGLEENALEDLERTIKAIKYHMDGIEPCFVQTVSKDEFIALSHGHGFSFSNMEQYKLKPLIEWMNEHMSGKWYRYDVTNFMFADETDAIIFELVWG